MNAKTDIHFYQFEIFAIKAAENMIFFIIKFKNVTSAVSLKRVYFALDI